MITLRLSPSRAAPEHFHFGEKLNWSNTHMWCEEMWEDVMRSINASCAYFHIQIHFWTGNYLNFIWFTKTRKHTMLHSCIEYIIFLGVFLIIFCLLKFLIGNWIDMRSIFSYAFLIHSECMRAAFPFSLYFSFILLSLRKCTANRNVQKFISGLWFLENENPFFSLGVQMEFHTFRTQIGLCTSFSSKNVCIWCARDKADIGIPDEHGLVVHKWTNK